MKKPVSHPKWECTDLGCNWKGDNAREHQEKTGHHNIGRYHPEDSI